MENADIGVIGLAVMGQNLVLNLADHGYSVIVYNRTLAKVDELLEKRSSQQAVFGARSLEMFFEKLARPRKVLLMVKAGEPVDQLIALCQPYLEAGDILIDGGNSHFRDSERRCRALEKQGILFVGTGISGGEEGARIGPSLMPGGHPDAWPHIRPMFEAIAAHVEGRPCCSWIGEGGAGHFVKMVHNGIEYGDMQLICEAYQLLSDLLGLEAEAIGRTFDQWNRGELESYLIEITAQIFSVKDRDGAPLIDKIDDRAAQKGTGRWTVESALELGLPLTLIAEALFARFLSALKEERLLAGKQLKGPTPFFEGDQESFIHALEKTLFAAKVISYAQGFQLLTRAAHHFKWQLDYGAIALLWRGGCIIRSRFLDQIEAAYRRNPALTNLLLDPYFGKKVSASQPHFREVIVRAVQAGIPTPCMSAGLHFYDSYRKERLPANLLQAQRDFFGAHTYQRIDQPKERFFHTDWSAG